MAHMMWEIEGAAWREGKHNGTLISERGLGLIPGVSRGTWENVLTKQGPCTHLIASINPDPWPLGSGVRLSVRLREDAGWSPWCCGERRDWSRRPPRVRHFGPKPKPPPLWRRISNVAVVALDPLLSSRHTRCFPVHSICSSDESYEKMMRFSRVDLFILRLALVVMSKLYTRNFW